MNSKLNAGIIQLCSSGDINENVKSVTSLIREAADEGAEFILTPENTTLHGEGWSNCGLCFDAGAGGGTLEENQNMRMDFLL